MAPIAVISAHTCAGAWGRVHVAGGWPSRRSGGGDAPAGPVLVGSGRAADEWKKSNARKPAARLNIKSTILIQYRSWEN